MAATLFETVPEPRLPQELLGPGTAILNVADESCRGASRKVIAASVTRSIPASTARVAQIWRQS